MAKRISWALATILGVYIAFTISRGTSFLQQSDPAVKVLGFSVIVIALLGIYVIARELIFGQRVARMSAEVSFDGKPAQGETLTEEQCETLFQEASQIATEKPLDWQSWYHVAVAYEINRDRRRARENMRKALALYLDH